MMRRIKIILMLLLLVSMCAELTAQRSRSKKKSVKNGTVAKKKKAASKKKAAPKKAAKKQGKKGKSARNTGGRTAASAQNVRGIRQTALIPVADEQVGTNAITEAQDTLGTRTVVITSAFKPSLQNAAKINFTAATAVADTARLPLIYKVPSYNLFFNYQPIAIQPLALPTDSGMIWLNKHRIKVGAGNLSTVMADGRFSFGDGKKTTTLLQTDFISSKGQRFAQQYSRFGLDVQSVINTSDNLEWTTHAFFNSATQYRYGFEPSTLTYTKEELKLTYNTLALEAGLKNKIKNEAGIDYHPTLSYYRFTDNSGGAENNLVLKAPIEKALGKIWSVRLGFTADLAKTNFSAAATSNNLLYINPSVAFTTPNFRMNLGIQPSWNNSRYYMLPDITAEARLPDTHLSLEAGWKGYFNKNSYRSLAGFNPWIGGMGTILNTRVREQYAGIKGTVGNHISFNGRVSLMKLYNQPVFINEGLDGKVFLPVFEPEMDLFRIHGELNYTVQESFSLLASTTFSRYSGLAVNADAWGLIPFEVTGTALWKPLKDLQLKADLFYRDGSRYRANGPFALTGKLAGATDLNLGAELGVTKQLNIWLQMNNLFNNTYQRWYQYPVFGFNVMGGVVYSFQ
ncbi:MAG: hypothetical protein JNK08_00210 [Sediminibacterium sp.]|nr:hypothetical protein [Sediminibacterium sp.]